MLDEAGDFLKQRAKMRLFAILVIVPLVMFFWGAGELWRCVRSVFGPSTITYTELSERGLRGYGYVRITDAAWVPDRAVALVEGNNVKAVYVPAMPATGIEVRGRHRVLVSFPASGVPEGTDLSASTEVVGWVQGSLDNQGGSVRDHLKTLTGAPMDECWVVAARGPSWLKGLGLAGGAVVFVGLVGLYLMKKPLNP